MKEAYTSKRQHSSAYNSKCQQHTHTDSGVHIGLQSGKSAVELAAEDNDSPFIGDKSGVLKVLCQHGARGALCYAAKNDLRDMLAELISKGHDLEECDQVLVYEALRCAQVLVYEALSELEECAQVLVYEALSCAQVPVYEALCELD
jgi:hypothetical protein